MNNSKKDKHKDCCGTDDKAVAFMYRVCKTKLCKIKLIYKGIH